jgi:sphingomyelin phosphodiesterase acid-like 3
MPRPHLLLALTLLLACLPAPAQSPAPTTTIPALFLSDIHLDPYADPAKVAKLNSAQISEWPAILAAPAPPTQPQDYAALQQACPVRGADTSNTLWQSSLRAIHAEAARARFVTVSGDLLAHQFDCKFKTLLPAATHADLLAFAEKTAAYVISSLRSTLPGVPVYIALGNNDSACGDYHLDPSHDDFLARMAPIVADAAGLSDPARAAALQDFAASGSYAAPLAAVANTRILVLDDIFLSNKYATCTGTPDPAPAAAQLDWLRSQLTAARQSHQAVWVVGHIPPGVDLYSTAKKLTPLCFGDPQMFLSSERLAEFLSSYSDVIRLALFGHTHSDEMRLLPAASPDPRNNAIAGTRPQPAATTTHPPVSGVPLKLVSSITAVNGNRPTFTLARIDPASATLTDYTVFIASNLTGVAATWSPEYTYSTTYRRPAFDPNSLSTLISAFQADPSAASPASQAYLRNYFPGDASSLLRLVWPQYACSLDHDSAQSFIACACPAGN